MAANIVINDGVGPNTGSIDRAFSFLGTAFTFSNFDDTGVAGWTWTLVDRPAGSAAALTTPNSSSTQLTPDVTGTYLVRLETFADAGKTIPDATDQDTLGIALSGDFELYVPAAGETDERGVRGWAAIVNASLKALHDAVEAPGGDVGSWPNPVVTGLQGQPVAATAPNLGEALVWDGAAWAPGAVGLDDPLLLASDGSAGAPALAWAADTNTGIYRPAANQLAISSGGVPAATFASGQTRLGNGTQVFPSLAFTADTNTGLYWGGSGVLNVSSDGSTVGRFNAAGIAVGVLGSAGSPAFAWIADPDCGLFYVASPKRIGVAIDGAEVTSLGDSYVRTAGGSEANPAFSFVTQPDAGMWLRGAAQLAFAVGGDEALRLEGSAQVKSGGLGSAAAPAWSFVQDADTGVYRSAADILAFATGGDACAAMRYGLDADGAAILNVLGEQNLSGSSAAIGLRIEMSVNAGDSTTGVSDVIRAEYAGSEVFAVNQAGTVRLQNGTAAAPALTFAGDTQDGIYRDGVVNTLGATGVPILGWIDSEIRVWRSLKPQQAGVDLGSVTQGFRFAYVNQNFATSLGTAAFPVFTFSAATTNGMFGTAGAVAFTVAATEIGRFTADGLLLQGLGSAATPALRLGNDGNTGLFQPNADQIGFSTGGGERMRVATTAIFLYEPTLAANGSQTEPAYGFDQEAGLGIYRNGPGQLGITVENINRILVTDTYITFGERFRATPGLMGSPGIAFSTDTDTGLYSVGANVLGVSCGGVLSTEFSDTQVRFPDGSVSGPSVSNATDTDTGFYWAGANRLFAIAGASSYFVFDGSLGYNRTLKDIHPNADDAVSLGTASLRYANVYGVNVVAGDLHLKDPHDPEGPHWKLIEQHDGIQAVNVKTGKRYRIKLEEELPEAA